MEIVVLGVSHRTAPLEVREQLAFHPDECTEALRLLRQDGLITEATLLSTCNRTELYAISKDPDGAVARGRELIRARKGMDPEPGTLAYVHRHRGGVEHLFRVAGGIDSMVLGEAAILGQVKVAFERATEAEAVGPVMGRLFPSALHAGKRCRTETEIGRGAVSLEKSGVQLTERIFGDLEDRHGLVVGAGDSGRRVAELLREAGIGSLAFANRTASRAEELAAEFNGETVAFDALAGHLAQTDILVTAVSSPQPVISRDLVARGFDGRRRGPLLILDLGVPRNVEPSAGKLATTFLYAVDDLQELMEINLGKRRKEIPAVEQIVLEEADRFFEWLLTLETTPVLVAMREEAERVRRETLDKFSKGLSAAEREQLERFSAGLVNKLMHSPTIAVRTCDVQTREGLSGLAWARRLFGLDPPPSTNGNGPERKS